MKRTDVKFTLFNEASLSDMTMTQHNDITTAYRSPGSLLSRQIMAISMTLLEDRTDLPVDVNDPVYKRIGRYGDFTEGVVASMSIKDLEKLGIGQGFKNLGETISELLNSGKFIREWIICMRSPDSAGSATLVTNTAYDYRSGHLYVKFNRDFRNLLLDYKGNYTRFRIRTLMSFTSEAAMNLYEYLYALFCVDLWKNCAAEAEDVSYTYQFKILQLRLILGIDTFDEKVSRELSKKEPDFDRIEQMLPENRKHERWSSFKQRILDPALNEINSLPDSPITISMDTITENTSHKVVQVSFTVNRRKDIALYNRQHAAEALHEYTSGRLSVSEASRLLILAADDEIRLKEMLDSVLDRQDISHLYAYIRKMLSTRDTDTSSEKKLPVTPVRTESGSRPSAKKNTINDFEQRHYTDEQYRELEMRKLAQWRNSD